MVLLLCHGDRAVHGLRQQEGRPGPHHNAMQGVLRDDSKQTHSKVRLL